MMARSIVPFMFKWRKRRWRRGGRARGKCWRGTNCYLCENGATVGGGEEEEENDGEEQSAIYILLVSSVCKLWRRDSKEEERGKI